MMNQLFITLVFFIKCCLQKFKVIAKYSAVQLAMTILLNGAIDKSKIHWLIIWCVFELLVLVDMVLIERT